MCSTINKSLEKRPGRKRPALVNSQIQCEAGNLITLATVIFSRRIHLSYMALAVNFYTSKI
jgi:hypothetical protein